jgi:hypothetical protein
MKVIFLILTIAAAVVNGEVMKLTPGIHFIRQKNGINISEQIDNIKNKVDRYV